MNISGKSRGLNVVMICVQGRGDKKDVVFARSLRYEQASIDTSLGLVS